MLISEDVKAKIARALLCSRLQLAELERGRPKLSTPERAKIQLNNRRFTVSATQICNPLQQICCTSSHFEDTADKLANVFEQNPHGKNSSLSLGVIIQPSNTVRRLFFDKNMTS